MREIKIKIKTSTHERLKGYAEPPFDSEDRVINRVLDALERHSTEPAPARSENQELNRGEPYAVTDVLPKVQDVIQVVSNEPPAVTDERHEIPDLLHTKPLMASLNGETFDDPNWIRLVSKLVEVGKEKYCDFSRLEQYCKSCSIRIIEGRGPKHFYYNSTINISVDRINANVACSALVQAVQELEVNLWVRFQWRDKEGATHPGRIADLHVGGKEAYVTYPDSGATAGIH